ncbi:hypothetical protein DMENIID0001_123010 [Sergentomyia squamirostris]
MGTKCAKCICPTVVQETTNALGGTELKAQIDAHQQAAIQLELLEEQVHKLELILISIIVVALLLGFIKIKPE